MKRLLAVALLVAMTVTCTMGLCVVTGHHTQVLKANGGGPIPTPPDVGNGGGPIPTPPDVGNGGGPIPTPPDGSVA